MASIWSCGGGTQSAAIGALIVRGVLPVPDMALIVDTERERSTTWAYMDDVLAPALAAVGCEIHRVPKSDFTRLDLWGGADGDTLLIGGYAYGGKAPMYCSGEWKREVARRWIRAQGVKSCELWMGISVDEMRRVRMSGLGWLTHRYPLIEQRMNRSACIALVRSMGWPDPPRSACYMCPNAGDREWLEMKLHSPTDWTAAVDLERGIRLSQPQFTLHSSGKTLDLVDFGEAQMSLIDNCAGMCWV